MKKIFSGKLKLKEISTYSDTLRLIFDENKISIDASCFWRVIEGNNVIFTSNDCFIKNNDSILFKKALSILNEKLNKTFLKEILISTEGSDFNFNKNYKIQFLTSSIKYESWVINIEEKQYVCMGGGNIAEFN